MDHLDCIVRSFTENTIGLKRVRDLSRSMRFPTMSYVRPAKPQISLRTAETGSIKAKFESTIGLLF